MEELRNPFAVRERISTNAVAGVTVTPLGEGS